MTEASRSGGSAEDVLDGYISLAIAHDVHGVALSPDATSVIVAATDAWQRKLKVR